MADQKRVVEHACSCTQTAAARRVGSSVPFHASGRVGCCHWIAQAIAVFADLRLRFSYKVRLLAKKRARAVCGSVPQTLGVCPKQPQGRARPDRPVLEDLVGRKRAPNIFSNASQLLPVERQLDSENYPFFP